MKKLDLAQFKTKPSLVNMEEAEIKAVEDLHTGAEDLNATQVAEITPTTTTITMATTVNHNNSLKNQIKKTVPQMKKLLFAKYVINANIVLLNVGTDTTITMKRIHRP